MTRKIVIAHYKENLDWCLNIKDKYDIKINDYPHNVQRELNRVFAPKNPLTFLP